MKLKTLALLISLACAPALPLAAEHHEPTGYLADFANDFDRASTKLVDLAGAIPDDQYGWRPNDKVRTVSEIYMHVAGTNFYLANALGVAPPADLPEELEKTVTAKAEVIEMLKKSQDQVRKTVETMDGELDREIELFGGKRSVRSIFMIVAGHTHEHLGQAIAYARSNDIAPPWSRPSE